MNDAKKLERNRRYRVKHREEIRLKEREYYSTNRAKVRLYNREAVVRSKSKLKHDVFSYYSGTDPPQCVNPFGEHEKPYTNILALSIDHINGKGGKERSKLNKHGGWAFYTWLRANNYPTGYQVLCMNCQFVKRFKNTELHNQYL